LHNVVILTKSWEGDDFFEGYNIDYSYYSKRIMAGVTHSEEDQITIKSTDTIAMGKWYHAVLTFDNSFVCFYLDGILQSKVAKKFPTRYLATDSVMLGNSANQKNLRFFNGSIDDVEIYHRVLSNEEVLNLYKASNPNRYAVLKKWIIILSTIIIFFTICVFLIRIRIKFVVEKEKEKIQLELNALEQQIKMLKAQMDPHFIFNSLNTILQLIITQQNDKAEIYLTKFSKLLREILESNTHETISLADELEILKKYLEIEALRFDEFIISDIQIGSGIDVQNTFIPHMMIQPFVENSIWHGLLSKKGEKILKVKFEIESENTLLCIIEDNGVGRMKSRLAKIAEDNASLAINFIEQRLELMSRKYKASYSLELIDKVDEKQQSLGTRVEITMPMQKTQYDKSNTN
jgi:two-component sensor histidine kinase